MKADNSFNSLAASPSYLSVGPGPTGAPSTPSFSCGAPGQMVALITTYDYHFVWPAFMQWFGNINGGTARRVGGFAMFRNEPYTVSSKTC